MRPCTRRCALAAGALLAALALAGCHRAQDAARAKAQTAAAAPPPASRTLRAAADRFLYRSERLRIARADIGRRLKADLAAGRYDAAAHALADLNRSDAADPRYEYVYRETLAALASCDAPDRPIERALLDFAAARPQSAWPHLLLGHYYFAMVCRARGQGWAQDVSGADWRSMANFARRAAAELDQALAIDPRIFPAYEDLIFLSDDLGSLRTTTSIYLRSRKYLPASFLLAADYMVALEPRWGGSYPAMYRFARAMRSHLKENPRFYMLSGWAYGDKALTYNLEREPSRALRYYYRALQYGDYTRWLKDAGRIADAGHNYRVAYAYYRRYLLYKPDDAAAGKALKELTPHCDPARHPECSHPPGAPWAGETVGDVTGGP